MYIQYVKDIEEEFVTFLETLEGKNLNFLIGSGASMPFLKSLKFKDSNLTFEDLYENSRKQKCNKAVNAYLSACFIYNSIMKGTYEAIKTSKDAIPILNNYTRFINNIYNILIRNSIQQPKRANIFTTNYDMFFECSFDNIVRNNSNIIFNDGSSGFVNKTISTTRFHTKVLNVGVDSRYEFELPMFNLLKLHGSINWLVDQEGKICISNQLDHDFSFTENEEMEIKTLESLVKSNELEEVLDLIHNSISENYESYSDILDKLSIVKPSKMKFSETVLEEHYYQMLRILSQELERKQSVLITFGFSFADEHIYSIIQRSLTNPNLMMYIFCFNQSDVDKFEQLFKPYNNVKLIYRKDRQDANFDFFNSMLGGW